MQLVFSQLLNFVCLQFSHCWLVLFQVDTALRETRHHFLQANTLICARECFATWVAMCEWGIMCKPNPPTGLPSISPAGGGFGNPPVLLPGNKLPLSLALPSDPTVLVCLVNAACANVQPKCKSTAGWVTSLAGGAAARRSKMGARAALDSTGAGFCTITSAAKKAQHLCSTLTKLALHSEKTSNHP